MEKCEGALLSFFLHRFVVSEKLALDRKERL